MKILHVSNGWEKWNGAANIARLIAGEQEAAGHQVALRRFAGIAELRAADEVWIHCGWMPCLWWAALWAKKAYWMPEACYDPVRLAYHGWKKKLAGLFERFFLRRCRGIVATCEAEREWIAAYLGRRCPPIEVQDIRRFFRLEGPIADPRARGNRPLHVLYLGRPHPLKGIPFLERAVNDLNSSTVHLQPPTSTSSSPLDLRIVSNAFGDEKAAVWQWADILCLPTLSDNLGLVIAEALERGKFVITTDGAPVWESFFAAHPTHGLYLSGYRTGDDQTRIKLLAKALGRYL